MKTLALTGLGLFLLLSRKSCSPPSKPFKGAPAKVLSWLPLMKEAQAATFRAKGIKVPLSLACAIMENESGGNPDSVGPTNDLGLWQFIPKTAASYGLSPSERRDPRKSTFAAFNYLGDLLLEWKRYPEQYAISAYNAGSQGVRNAYPQLPKAGRYYKNISAKRAKYRYLDC